MMDQERPRFLDLFAGCGGLSLGFLDAGFRGMLAVDNDANAVACYNRNLHGTVDAGAVLQDLSELNTRTTVLAFLRRYGIEPGMCDVLIGGPPCQSFSVVGRNKTRALAAAGGDIALHWDQYNRDRASLFEIYALFVEVLAPQWFLFENVPSIKSHAVYPALMTRFRQLKDSVGHPLVYNVSAGTYLASHYGLAQNRRRFIMVGRNAAWGPERWTDPPHLRATTVAEALDDLPAIKPGSRDRLLDHTVGPQNAYQERMRQAPAWRPHWQPAVHDHICRWHNPDDTALFSRMRPGARFADEDVQRAMIEINPHHRLRKYAVDKFKDKLHRLDPERPAWTVTAHLSKDCYKFIHHRQPRTISVREAARLQSFPDWFHFDGVSMIEGFRLIGNAVPPLLAETLARHLIRLGVRVPSLTGGVNSAVR